MTASQSAATSPATYEDPSRPFLIPPDELSEAQKAFITRIESGPRKRVPINQRVWMQNMPFADVAERFGAYVSAEAPMGAREKEICILVVADFWHSKFEWHWHEKLAHKAGLTKEQTDAIRDGQVPRFETESEAVTYEIARALLHEKSIPDHVFARASSVLGINRVLDLIGLMGLYGMIAHTIMMYRLQIPSEGSR